LLEKYSETIFILFYFKKGKFKDWCNYHYFSILKQSTILRKNVALFLEQSFKLKMPPWSGNICYIKRACTIYSILGSQDWIVRLNAYTVRGILARIMQGNNARKVILEVYAFCVLQCTVFGQKSKHKMDVTA